MHAVAEAARKVACTGATPVAATNCLELRQPGEAGDHGAAFGGDRWHREACTALGTPITGGNVSLYNETKGEGIYPTPVIGIVGILEDVTKAVPIAATYLDLEAEWQLHKCLAELADQSLIHSACDVSDGGVATALAQASFRHSIGARVGIVPIDDAPAALAFFAEPSTQVILTCSPANKERVEELVFSYPELSCWLIGETVAGRLEMSVSGGTSSDEGNAVIDCSIDELRKPWARSLEAALYDEVTA
jgi:phosphoribosylformylglycinamidine (FGAM) synthase-like enzyme